MKHWCHLKTSRLSAEVSRLGVAPQCAAVTFIPIPSFLYTSTSVSLQVYRKYLYANLNILARIKDDLSPCQRLEAGIAVCKLVRELGVSLKEEEVNVLASVLVLQIDEERQVCPQIDWIFSTVNSEGRL